MNCWKVFSYACVWLLPFSEIFAEDISKSHTVKNVVSGGTADPMAVGIGQWLLSCVLVIGLIFLLAYLLKKTKFVSGMKNNNFKIVAIMPIGNKEKLTIVQVGSKKYLLGVTSQQITKLADLESDVIDTDKGQIKDMGFKQILSNFSKSKDECKLDANIDDNLSEDKNER